jgi:hypothetical protein
MELINKRKLQKDLAAYWGIPYDWDGEMDQLCEDALVAIYNAEVVDAVEVTHCEDCRYGHYCCGYKKYECHHPLYPSFAYHRGRHYCGYGEKRI